MMDKRKWFSLLSACTMLANMVLLAGSIAPAPAYAQRTRTFPETGKTVGGRFLQYWEQNGGLAQQGYPISEEMQEKSDTDGKTYTVQYFERAVFELHPENKAPNDVLLSLLGNFLYRQKYPDGAPGQVASTNNPRKFPETGKTLGGVFRQYWEKNGGLAQQGYPISDEFKEVSQTEGKTYTVQYFERAVFELHPENQPPYNVLLSLLGKFRFDSKGGGGKVTPPSLNDIAAPGWSHVAVTTNNVAFFYNTANGRIVTARLNADGTLIPGRRYPESGEGGTTGATHIAVAPNNIVILYSTGSGNASLMRVNDAGSLGGGSSQEWTPGWTYMAIDTTTGDGIYYNATSDTIVTSRLNPDGTLRPGVVVGGTPDPSTIDWSQFVPIGNNKWFWYAQPAEKDGIGGVVMQLLPDGKFTALGAELSFDTSWSHIASGGGFLYFYNKTNGNAMTATIAQDSSQFTVLKSYGSISREWTHFAAAPNRVFLIYSSATGNIATDQIAADGSAQALKRYSPTR